MAQDLSATAGTARTITPRDTPRSDSRKISNAPSLSRTPRQSSTASLNGNTAVTSPCDCPGCPGNISHCGPEMELEEANSNTISHPAEDYLDTLDRKVNEIMNRDSRRSSSHDLYKKSVEVDHYGPMSLGYNRKKTRADLGSNSNSPRPRPPDGAIRFEDDDKESSTETIDSSQEELAQAWSDEDVNHYVLRRRR